MAVEPVTSENTTVTVLRTSAPAGTCSASGDPHRRQNRARSGFSSPHTWQVSIGKVYSDRERSPPGWAPLPCTAAPLGQAHVAIRGPALDQTVAGTPLKKARSPT